MSSICIYVNVNNNKTLASDVIDYLKPDSVIFSEETNHLSLEPDITQYACFSFYNTSLSFDGYVVFLGVEDFLFRNKDYKNPKMLFIMKEEISKLNKESLNNTSVYLCDKGKIRKAKNAELQSIFR